MYISLIAFASVLLIAYWWSNAGAFSALIHLLCVITAGALAFALWEPIAYAVMERGMDGHGKGIALAGTFIVTLAVLRFVTDKVIPMNLTIPRAADIVVGGLFGACSGVLSVGLVLISFGYFQSTVTIFDWTGWSRRTDVPIAPTFGSDNAPGLALVSATSGFFNYLSWGAYTPWLGGGTLGTHAPDLVRTSASLNRDSTSEGLGRIGIQPSAISGLKLLDVPSVALNAGVGTAPEAAWAVAFTVAQDGFDGGGQQFLLSASQARVIGDGKGGRNATVAYPLSWVQGVAGGGLKQFYFSSVSNVATSIPAQGEGSFVLLFPKSALNGQQPKFIEIKGARFRAPAAAPAGDILGGVSTAAASDAGAEMDDDATNIDRLIEFPDPTYAIGGTVINSNDKGGLQLDKSNFIIGGEQKFPRNSSAAVSTDLRVRGFQVSPEQRILRLDARAVRGGVRIFPDLNQWIRTAGAEAQDARVAVVDESGAKYFAVGLVEDDGQWVFVKSMGGKPLRLRDIPIQPLGSGKKLYLHFRVPGGVNVRSLVLAASSGDRVVNTINLAVPARD